MDLAGLLHEHLPRARLRALLDTFSALNIGVIGDFFLDAYYECDPALDEPSLETGRTCYQAVRLRRQPGAAGTVAANLAGLGVGRIEAVGFCGDDGEGYELRRSMEALGLRLDGFCTCPERFTPTYCKPVYVERRGNGMHVRQELERIDIRNRRRTPAWLQQQLISHVQDQAHGWNGSIVMDQVSEAGCGTVTPRLRDYICTDLVAAPGLTVLVDSRERIHRFRRVIIKPNAREAAALRMPRGGALQRSPTAQRALNSSAGTAGRNAAPAAHGARSQRTHPGLAGPNELADPMELADPVELALLLTRRSGRPVFLTLGPAGLVAAHQETAVRIPAVPLAPPLDPVGAGDTTSAAATVALAAGATVVQAGLIAVLAASITVQQLGTTGTATPAQIMRRHQEVTRGD